MIILFSLIFLAFLLNVVVRRCDTQVRSSVNKEKDKCTWTGDEGWKEAFYKASQMKEEL